MVPTAALSTLLRSCAGALSVVCLGAWVGAQNPSDGSRADPEQTEVESRTAVASVESLVAQALPDGRLEASPSWSVIEGTALTALVLLGEGSTFRTGPYKEQFKRAFLSIRPKNPDLPGTFRERALLAFAAAEGMALSGYRVVLGDARRHLLGVKKLSHEEGPQDDGGSIAWMALAVRATRDATESQPALPNYEFGAVLERLEQWRADIEDPQVADLVRLTLATAADATPVDDPELLSVGRRLAPRTHEEAALALLGVGVLAHDARWAETYGRLVERARAICQSPAHEAGDQALAILVEQVVAARSHLSWPSLAHTLRVKDAEGAPVSGIVVLRGFQQSYVWPPVTLDADGCGTLRRAPVNGMRVDVAVGASDVDLVEAEDWIELGVLRLPTDRAERVIEFTLPR